MTIKQKLFINKYFEYRNVTQAVLNIYNVKNRNSAAVIGSRLLRNVKVRREIERILEANKTFLPFIIDRLKESIEKGNGKERVEAIKMVFKLYGYY